MKEVAITFIVSEKDYNKAVKETLGKFDKLGGAFPRECFKETAKMIRKGEDNIIELSKRKSEVAEVDDDIETAIMEKSLEQMSSAKFGKEFLLKHLETLLGLTEDEKD